jgi:hypothetical protein
MACTKLVRIDTDGNANPRSVHLSESAGDQVIWHSDDKDDGFKIRFGSPVGSPFEDPRDYTPKSKLHKSRRIKPGASKPKDVPPKFVIPAIFPGGDDYVRYPYQVEVFHAGEGKPGDDGEVIIDP